MHSFSILGSCVSRDSIEFIENINCPIYIARSSLVSILSIPPLQSEVINLEVDNDIHRFHKNNIIDDIYKKSLEKLSTIKNKYLIIDLIEERVPLGVFKSGSIVTLSQPSRLYSNLDTCVSKKIMPFSPEYLQLFEDSLQNNLYAFKDIKIVIHKAFYVDEMAKNGENIALEKMYKLLINNLKDVIIIEPKNRLSNANHKHGPAPYHYIDSYYFSFIEQLSNKIKEQIPLKKNFSMNK